MNLVTFIIDRIDIQGKLGNKFSIDRELYLNIDTVIESDNSIIFINNKVTNKYTDVLNKLECRNDKKWILYGDFYRLNSNAPLDIIEIPIRLETNSWKQLNTKLLSINNNFVFNGVGTSYFKFYKINTLFNTNLKLS